MFSDKKRSYENITRMVPTVMPPGTVPPLFGYGVPSYAWLPSKQAKSSESGLQASDEAPTDIKSAAKCTPNQSSFEARGFSTQMPALHSSSLAQSLSSVHTLGALHTPPS